MRGGEIGISLVSYAWVTGSKPVPATIDTINQIVMIEIWRTIEDYPNYQVSNFGRVKSFKRGAARILKQQPTKRRGVMMIHLGKIKTVTVHKLVAIAFIPNPKNKPQINHIDGNPNNNYANNLEWATALENIQHAFRTGLNKVEYFSGENSGGAKLTNEQANEIRMKYSKELRNGTKLASEYGIHKCNIAKIVRGVAYKNAIY